MNMENRDLSTADLAYGRREEAMKDGTVKDQTAMHAESGTSGTEEHGLLDGNTATSYSNRWSDIQGRFVDEPQESVKQADSLVADVIQQLAQRFAQERSTLEDQWQRGSEVSTEDLRQALQHYRSFFQRLLAA
jgi:hypothetical protein